MKFTGERVVPKDMPASDITLAEHLARYNFALPYCKNKSVLDAACGSGYGSKKIAVEGEALSVVGVDVDPEAVQYARDEYCVNAEVYDLESEFPKGNYEVIVSFETIEHLENPDFFLSQVALSCKRFIFSIPLDNPSKFHKQVYNLTQARDLIAKYFPRVLWYSQTYTEIKPLTNQQPTFLVGVAFI
jgi:2-polyprenyl-3-methyl-5-hydroxy-6-metoxy-1,4-benzoquinol methylase